MSIKIKSLTVRNFMSIGNQVQAVNFDQNQLTLIIGENLDLGGEGNRNGVGKSSLVNALSYAIYGQALTNIKKDNLVNKINNKGMLVTVTFDVNGTEYKIDRGRKPNVLKFTINGNEKKPTDTDESQGDSRETQKSIEDVINMSHDMFKHLVALNTYTEPFLSMKAGDQRNIIEQLLGITLLSEKANALKELIKETKDKISAETLKIETIKSSNEKIQFSIDSLERKSKLWTDSNQKYIDQLNDSIQVLSNIDIDLEIVNQRLLTEWNKTNTEINSLTSSIARLTSTIDKEQRQADGFVKELEMLNNHQCHECGQQIHNVQHEEMVRKKNEQLASISNSISQLTTEKSTMLIDLGALTANLHSQPSVIYNTLEDALNHKNSIETLLRDLNSKKNETNPYNEQILDLKNTALQEINWDKVNQQSLLKDHQEFLLKLLTNKDSFVRKRIIDQNLAFLNQRLSFYLDKIGLPHLVEFQNDLSVTITQLGQDLDFDNLSRGERNRLILSLSWAFRDVWENLYCPINLLFIDELVDSGMDANGVDSSVSILKSIARERNKNVFLISHRDELIARVNSILKVVKETGFTSFESDNI